jgi:hypothetical protein
LNLPREKSIACRAGSWYDLAYDEPEHTDALNPPGGTPPQASRARGAEDHRASGILGLTVPARSPHTDGDKTYAVVDKGGGLPPS